MSRRRQTPSTVNPVGLLSCEPDDAAGLRRPGRLRHLTDNGNGHAAMNGGGTGDYLGKKARIAAAAAAASASGYRRLTGGLGGSYATLASFTRLPMGPSGRADVVRGPQETNGGFRDERNDLVMQGASTSLRWPQQHSSRRSSVWSSSMTMTSTMIGTYRTAERSATEGRRVRREPKHSTEPRVSTGKTWPERDVANENGVMKAATRDLTNDQADEVKVTIPPAPPPPAQNGFILENGMLKMISTPKPALPPNNVNCSNETEDPLRGNRRKQQQQKEQQRHRVRERTSSADRHSSLERASEHHAYEEHAVEPQRRQRRRRRKRQRAASGDAVQNVRQESPLFQGRGSYDTLKSDKSEEELLELQRRLEKAAAARNQPLYQNLRYEQEDHEEERNRLLLRQRRRQRRQYSEERQRQPHHRDYAPQAPPPEHIYSHLMPHNLRQAQQQQHEQHLVAEPLEGDRRQQRRRQYLRQSSFDEDALRYSTAANGLAPSVPV